MRYLRTIAAFVAVLLSAACTVDPTVVPSGQPDSDDSIMVIGRVTHFDDYDVSTRSSKNPETEGMIYNMAVAIFPIENNAIGNCVYYEYKKGSEVLFTIDRQIRDSQSNEYIYNVDAPYVMYVFANCEEMESVNTSYTLEQMKAIISSVDGIGMHTDEYNRQCFPMMGSLGDAIDTNGDKKGDNTISPEGDGKMFILKPNSASDPGLPLVNGDASDLLTIPMDAMFAKINFTIKVTADQFIEDNFSSRFVLSGYDVNNVPEEVTFSKSENSVGKTDVVTNVKSYSSNNVTSASNVAVGANTVTFSFYLPERYLTPATESKDYDYPFKKDGVIRGQDSVYMQRFKPLLADAENQKPTYVTIRGEYRDHQNHLYEVDYNIYLGSDNYGNFDIARNGEYNNYITIRGVTASDDMSDKQNVVSIDHRVNVNWKSPVIINLRREVLLDSHFEVRPLRIRKNPAYTGDLSNAKVKVEVVYDKTPAQKWIGLERSFGNGTQSTSSTYLVATDLAVDRQNSKGKRKYFTTDLTTNTLSGESQKDNNGYSTTGGQSVVVPVTAQDEAVWIYVDEALVAEAGDAIRKATIRVSVAEDGTNYGAPIDYVIQQRQLFPVTYNNITYLIEYEEEYLHNFDADDSYGQTDFDGMQWGLPNEQLSHTYRAFFATGVFSGVMDWLLDNDEVKPFYDFYLTRDISNTSAERRDNSGYTFCTEIISTINGVGGIDDDSTNDITTLHLGNNPKSAIEYCYNKNKRNADGLVAWYENGVNNVDNLVWYLPAIDEIENIMMGAYSSFIEFQDKYYWSSQPAFYRGYGHYFSYALANEHADYYFDDITSARSTKVVYNSNLKKHINASSGVDGYEQLMEIYKPLWGMGNDPELYRVTSTPFTHTSRKDGKNFTTTIDSMTYKTNHPGNKPRTSYARVRCVRKAN